MSRISLVDGTTTSLLRFIAHQASSSESSRRHGIKGVSGRLGPASDTGRIADLSPSLMDDLKIKTDDEVEIIFPA
jgi:hypothetical protein